MHTNNDDPIIQLAIQNLISLELDSRSIQLINGALDRPTYLKSPWLWCWKAMEQRIIYGDYVAALQHAQYAIEMFTRSDDDNGKARAVAEAAIAHYHLGQYSDALQLLKASPSPTQASCLAAQALAAYLNTVGLNDLTCAIEYIKQGIIALAHEPDAKRRVRWQIALKRNLMAAYHYRGDLVAARQVSDEAFQLVEAYQIKDYHYSWLLYERGLLEQRAGQLSYAIEVLRAARGYCEQMTASAPLWNWIVAAEGHALRDQGNLIAADATYQLSGWGEGDEGPLMLWLLLERWNEARCAAEARLAAAHASHAIFEITSLSVFLTLLQHLRTGATATIRENLRQAVDTFRSLDFYYHRASVLLLLAWVEYNLNSLDAGDIALAEALEFGRAREYYNFVWWHPQCMQQLIARANTQSIEPEYCQRLMRIRDIQIMQKPQITLSIRCFGLFEVVVNNKPISLAQWQGYSAGVIRMQRLLLYLALHREPQSINVIAQYVWSERKDCINISANMHVTINGLRRALEPGLSKGSDSKFILKCPQGYQLAPHILLSLDLDRFTERLAHARKKRAFGCLDEVRIAYRKVEQLYTGSFSLAKVESDESEWYRQAFCEAVHWLSQEDLQQARYDACIMRANRLLRENADDIIAIELLIEAYLAIQNRRAARRMYNRAIRANQRLSPRISAQFAPPDVHPSR